MDSIPPMLSSSPPPMTGNEEFGETEEDEDIVPGFSSGRLDLEEDRTSSDSAIGKKTLPHPLPGTVSPLSRQPGAPEQHSEHPTRHVVDEPAVPLVNGIDRSLKGDVLVNGILDPSEAKEVPGLKSVISNLPEKSSLLVSVARDRSASGGSADFQDLARSDSAAVNEPDRTSAPDEKYDSMQPAHPEDAEIQSIEKDIGSEPEDDWDDWTEHSAVPVKAAPVESKPGESQNVGFEMAQGWSDSAGESPENLGVSDQGKDLHAEIPVILSEPDMITEDDEWAEFAEAESFEKTSDTDFVERSDEQQFMPVEPSGLVDAAAVPLTADIFNDVLAAAFNPEPAAKPDASAFAGGLETNMYGIAGGLWSQIENLDETNALGFRWDSSALRRNMLLSLNLSAQSHFAMQKKDPVNLHKNSVLGDILIPTTADKSKFRQETLGAEGFGRFGNAVPGLGLTSLSKASSVPLGPTLWARRVCCGKPIRNVEIVDHKPNFGLVKPGNESPAFSVPDSPTKRSFADSEPALSHSTRHARTASLNTSPEFADVKIQIQPVEPLRSRIHPTTLLQPRQPFRSRRHQSRSNASVDLPTSPPRLYANLNSLRPGFKRESANSQTRLKISGAPHSTILSPTMLVPQVLAPLQATSKSGVSSSGTVVSQTRRSADDEVQTILHRFRNLDFMQSTSLVRPQKKLTFQKY